MIFNIGELKGKPRRINVMVPPAFIEKTTIFACKVSNEKILLVFFIAQSA
jgi:hypothetical protein